MTIREIIRKRRKDLNLTQAELADKMGIGHASIGRYESGKTPLTEKMIQKFSDALDIDLLAAMYESTFLRTSDTLIDLCMSEMGYEYITLSENGGWLIRDEETKIIYDLDEMELEKLFHRFLEHMKIDFKHFLKGREYNGTEK